MNRDKVKDKLLAFKLKKEISDDMTKRGSRLLFYVGTAYMIFGLLQSDSFINTIFIICVSVVIIMLGLLSRKNSPMSLVLGLVILFSASCVDFINFDRIGFIGLTIRLVLLGFLASGVYHSFASDKILSEYDSAEN